MKRARPLVRISFGVKDFKLSYDSKLWYLSSCLLDIYGGESSCLRIEQLVLIGITNYTCIEGIYK